MNDALPWIIAFFFMITTVFCGVNWAFYAYEKTQLQNEEYKIFIRNLGLNKRLADDVAFLESKLRTYVQLSNLYKCKNADELHLLIRDLEIKLYDKNYNMKEKK